MWRARRSCCCWTTRPGMSRSGRCCRYRRQPGAGHQPPHGWPRWDAAVLTLDTLSPSEAAALLARLAARPGMAPGTLRWASSPGCAGTCHWRSGCSPASCGTTPPGPPAGWLTDLAAARDRLAFMHAENVSVAAALRPVLRRTSRRGSSGCSAASDWFPVPTSTPTPPPPSTAPARTTHAAHLDELYDQHLLTEPAPGRYQLHDLLREHARTLAAATIPRNATPRPGGCSITTCTPPLAAGRHIARRARRRPPPPAGSRGRIPRTCPPTGRRPPGWKPSAPTCTPPRTTPPPAGAPGTPSRYPPR